MKTLILQFFTWWNGSTWGTRFHIWRHGEKVGTDASGNTYYRNRDDSRRWVMYEGLAEPSSIPPGWHGWMHHKTDATPDSQNAPKYDWELPHKSNQTGTAGAYRPPSSLYNPEPKSNVSGDYEAWTP